MKSEALKVGIIMNQGEMKNVKLEDFGQLNWKMQNGKLERTVFQSWIATDLGKIKKVDTENKTDEENKKIRENVIFEVYLRSIQMANAFLFGIVKSRQEIDDLAKSKKQAIADEQTKQRENPSQNLPNYQNPNELYYSKS